MTSGNLSWYSASIHMAVLVDGHGVSSRWLSVVMLRASSSARAAEAAFEWGEANESIYENADGQRVRWAFERVGTIDEIGTELADGAEVFAEGRLAADEDSLPFDVAFHPLSSRIGESGVGKGSRDF